MQTEPPKRDFLPALTGIRGLTIMWMVIGHMYSILGILPAGLSGIVRVTGGVRFRMDLLFVLSGFLTAHVYMARRGKLSLKAYAEFLRSRLIRLYPSYAVVLLLAIAGIAVARAANIALHQDYSVADMAVNLAMLQSWPYLTRTLWTWNSSLWFVSALWFACLFVSPLAWMLVHKLRRPGPTYLWVFAPLAVCLTVLQFTSLKEFWWATRASCEFLSGGALFVLYASRSAFITAAQKHLDKTVLVFLVLSVLTPVLHADAAHRVINCMLVAGVPFLLAGTTATVSATAKFLSTRPMLLLGEMSYALFLSQDLSIRLLQHLLPAARFSNSSLLIKLLVVLAWFGFILTVAGVFYRLVEVPCAAALKNLFRKRSSTVATKGPYGVAAALRQPE
jgi:peptidoglycan/LPS O-acetylase OafA/YrhL